MTNNTEEEIKNKKDRFLPVSIVLAAILIAGAFVYKTGVNTNNITAQSSDFEADSLAAMLFATDGIQLPVRWGDLGKQLIAKGVIDADKFEAIYANRGGLTPEEKQLLYGAANGNLTINARNSGVILNLLWAFGLANKNEILENGPMTDPRYGGAGNFASTGGWTIAKGGAMDHYSKYSLVVLNSEQQKLVEAVSGGIYRPCCGNSAYFPDCNHGMAMLGLLELMASQGASEADMYKAALVVNSFWFSDTYLTIEKYLQSKGIGWQSVDPKQVLGVDFSSGSGFQNILKQIAPVQNSTGGGCSVQ
ncbi:MAG: hypothetical protein UY23_C0001G0393 [Candidatus Jorgensenbacteria bacterium GW2011_GWA1_48_11]|uniref:Uncharacterized protein n=1 Tax=Candidatus Jorgensenbacteria bacterium GW2011_GWA1_48_11 TaxID=1618660 RepID=A0A0G1UCE1_9BACT|nr:MAG: hypothetical protein UY23_C0001G0393 [Candidatus Jorgensenbacteria bacterium GW2011_GWA1_48_11]KKW12278.1 MAG: hypothetical protein UY51_C0005G0520 [Candidatus Jorgensenbacteria bacterium GW2011_GWB1_49_9]